MNIFDLRQQLIDDYARYVKSFIAIRDARIREHVDANLDAGLLWPEARIGLNPSFAEGGWIDELVEQGVLHDECARIFRIKDTPETVPGRRLRLHRHQVEAIHAARTGRNYVLTTGTGSGKSLSYIVPIVDHVLRSGAGRGHIQAIVVYPMNALANSQEHELEKFLQYGYPQGQSPVTFARYTGQESDDKRRNIVANPPDILLTNYVMLELILTRTDERQLVTAARDLRFLVFDELHTYRGRQGADVALLARRVREACEATRLQCVGTSATMATGGTFTEQRRRVAEVASLLFGSTVEPDHVIGETLRRATPPLEGDAEGIRAALRARLANADAEPPSDHAAFIEDPLSRWIEGTLGMEPEAETGRLIRVSPMPIRGPIGAARRLVEATGWAEDGCASAIQRQLLAGSRVQQPDTGFPVFAFRLHQFISRGDTAYATLEPESTRHLTVNPQTFVPGDRHKLLLPLAFCRECGQEYYVVRSDDHSPIEGRRLSDPLDDAPGRPGFLYTSRDNPWPDDFEEQRLRIPENWVETSGASPRLRSDRKKLMPQLVRVQPDGRVGGEGQVAWFVPAPFRFCLACGISYGGRQRSDFPKLGTLGSEGRSTATTILSLSAIRQLRREEALSPEARKLLSFTDNRQDAALQAGHFNDFIEVGLLRSALYRAVSAAGPDLVRAHLHAIWLAQTGMSLGSSLRDILDLGGDQPALSLLPSIRADVEREAARTSAREHAARVLGPVFAQLNQRWGDSWLDDAFASITRRFEDATGRWRTLYLAALAQAHHQTRIINDASRAPEEKQKAKKLRREAEAQVELLLATSARLSQSDFYSYRYFASEGFLPGYSFPRLPLSAFIPGRRNARGDDEFLSRPRFLAISEFGPRNSIYHEGSRYVIYRAIFPVEPQGEGSNTRAVPTREAKRCDQCGYLHLVAGPSGQVGPDLCEHRFVGDSFGDDTEFSNSYSQIFAKLTGIAFMSGYAETTWFANLRGLWGRSIPNGNSVILLKKRHGGDGPDYLAAPFAPNRSRPTESLYALEFKGRSGKVSFGTEAFQGWSVQAANIQAQDFTTKRDLRLKSWVLCFNYAFAADPTGRPYSTLLVEDPWVGQEEASPFGSAATHAFVVRQHLARQCRMLGMRNLGGHVVQGTLPETNRRLPPVFRIDHPHLRNRRYVGSLAGQGPGGEIVFSDPAWGFGGGRAPARVRVLIDRNLPQGATLIRALNGSADRMAIDVFVDIRVLDPNAVTSPDVESWIDRLVGWPGPRLFIGQDATMLRRCMRTPAGRELGGEEFVDPIEIRGADTDTLPEAGGYLQVLRNGSVIAAVNRVSAAEDGERWWRAS